MVNPSPFATALFTCGFLTTSLAFAPPSGSRIDHWTGRGRSLGRSTLPWTAHCGSRPVPLPVIRAIDNADADVVGVEEDGELKKEGKGLLGGFLSWWEIDGKEDLKTYAVSLALALTMRTFVLEPRYIPSLSMYPTFEIGDQLAVDKFSKYFRTYQKKDVVVFRPPPAFNEYTTRTGDEALIKRIIAVGGDTVQIKSGSLYINGEEQFEDYTFEEPEYQWGPDKVPAGMVMVLGDNRNHSLDSHIWGFLPEENVIGRAIFKYWPPWRAGAVEI
ncbi:unnamed protein product [Discosporangium mesarthrocarpum]